VSSENTSLPEPEPPSHLKSEGRAIWIQFCGRTTQHQSLESYCAAYERFRAARGDIEARGTTILVKSDRGHEMERVNPNVAVEAQAQRTMLGLANKLGLALWSE
jgi:P27 family predicted phage terminase small subunit